MNNTSYKQTYRLRAELRKAYSLIKKSAIMNSEWLKDNFIVIRTAYLSVKGSLKSIRELPADTQGNIRLSSYAEEYFRFSGNTVEIPKLLNYLESVSDKVCFNGDEIAVIPEILKLTLIISLSNEIESSGKEDSRKKADSAVEGLRILNNYVFEDLYEKLSKCESSLNRDYVYRHSDKRSKDVYRHKISELAKLQQKDEVDVVNDLLEKASQIKVGKKSTVGYYLFRLPGVRHFYFPMVLLLTIIFAVVFYNISYNAISLIFSIIPLYYISRFITERIFSVIGSSYVTRLKLKTVPKTLVTVITLISDEESVDSLCEKCIQYMYSNNQNGLYFGFLADLPESISPLTPQDNNVAAYAEKKIRELNLKYGNRFFCAIRAKKSDTEDGMYRGCERKRGAVEDFLQAIENENSDEFVKIVGDVYKAKYFAALDNDTRPDIDSVSQLVSVLENPIYEPKINGEKMVVSEGYAVAVPKIETELDSVMQNLFTKIFGGKAGSETYSYPSFNIYNDIFGESIFSGKGVINISMFNKVLGGVLGSGSVLSHDIIEGSFLRTVYVSDVVFYDKTPKNLISYTSRNDRWTRGDWQNIRFICGKIKTANGSYIKNPISALSKYKIFDNLMRSLVNWNLYILLLIDALTNSFLPTVTAFIFLFWDFLSELIMTLLRPHKFLPLKYKSGVLTNLERSFLYSFSKFIFLPYFAFIDIKAICKAICRMIRRKKLLEWRTSAQSDSSSPAFSDYVKNMAWQFTALIFCLNLKFLPIVIFWLLGIPYAVFLSKNTPKSIVSNESDAVMKEMWKYFEDFLNEKTNYLPPDNYQEKPLGIYANRTSPTNIGLTMLTVLGAYDMGFIDEDRLYFFTDKILSSVESLETCHGHLFNWYDISTKSVLWPKYVSSVDSGNFICCIYALRNGLKDFNTVSAANLAKRLDAIIKNTDMSFLYDKKRNLFTVGYDYENEKFTKSYYDLFASESRLTSYYAIASGQVDKKHWHTLSRPTVNSNGNIGIKSWSGTAFEYLMPHLLLPLKEGSLSHEAVLFAISEQINRTKKLLAFIDDDICSIPWGISESCYYTLGTDLAYQYRAFGVDKLALSRHSDQENEVVISPYSTLLSLPFDYRNSVKNLNLLSEYDSKGKYGYYEAIDFHKTSDCYMPKTVSSFMVHHIGMSFLSLLNLKKDNIMQKRFMDDKMKAFELLLDEKVPEFNSLSHIDESWRFSARKERYQSKPEEINTMNPDHPICKAYSDGTTSLVVTNCGESILKYENTDVTHYKRSDFNGIFAFLKIENTVLPFSYAPLCDNGFQYKTVFHDGFALLETRWRNYELNQKITVIPENNCEIRAFTVKNNTSTPINTEMLIYFEPILQERHSYSVHPAFSNLFIESQFNNRTGKLSFIRRCRTDGSPQFKLDVFFDSITEYDFELSRFNVLKTNSGKESLKDAFDLKFSNSTAGPVNVCAAIKFNLQIEAKSSKTVNMFLSFGKETKDISVSDNDIFGNAADDLAYMLMKKYKKYNISSEDIRIYEFILNAIMSKKSLKGNALAYKNVLGKEELWKYGISGNLPIILVKTDEDCIDNCRCFIGAYALLQNHGVECDMVFCFTEDTGYNRKIIQTLRSIVSSYGMNYKIGKSNGIFLININDINEFSLLQTAASYVFDLNSGRKIHTSFGQYKKTIIRDVSPVKMKYLYKTGIGGFTEKGFAIDDKKLFTHKPPWCNVHANTNFGTLVSDSSLGFTYAENSYKNKITSWDNDVSKDNDGEKLYLIIGKGGNKRVYDLIRNSSVILQKNCTEYFAEAENVFVSVKVFVPNNISAKVIKVKIENSSLEEVKLKFEPKIIMSDTAYPDTVNCVREQDTLFFSNEYNTEFKHGTVFLKGNGMRPEGENLITTVTSEKSKDFSIILGYGHSEKFAKEMSQMLDERKINEEELKLDLNDDNDIQIKTPSQELNLLYNYFLKNQIIKCRIYAKTGFYQCSGAYGFRDQLQDSLCISTLDPSFLRHQILLNSSHQFIEGDVMHWFHQNKSVNGKICGVRSRSSDDLLWLPYSLCEYIEKTNDLMFLVEKTPYLSAQILESDEDEKYVEADISDEYGTIYDHGKRAVLKGITKGPHGLLDFGSGDWNDGFNKLKGGETVWGTFFIIMVLERFSKLCQTVGDKDFSEFCEKTANEYRTAIEENAWSEDRYIRGFFPSGKKLGDADSPECKIDIISQSFASICGGFEHTETSLETAEKYLVDKKNGIVKLFTPPFRNNKETPGYIIGYIPGIRENGGQYTHASVWYALALLKNGEVEKAFEVLELINPINHSKTLDDVKNYRGEPYVLSADVYTNPSHYGMSGWSWYTGSAGWYFKTVTEEFLGIKLKGNAILIQPHVPKTWHNFSAEIKKDGTTISLTATRSADHSDSGKLFVDNIETDSVPLDGKHHNVKYFL